MDDIEELVKKLGDPDPKVKSDAAEALSDAAFNGADITVAVSALVEALSDRYARVRGNAALALRNAARNGTNMSVAIPALVKALSDAKKTVQKRAARALESADTHGADISAAIPALAKLLSDEDVRGDAVWTLMFAATKGADISVAIPALPKAFSDRDVRVRENAVCALKYAALLHGADISAAVPALAEAVFAGDKDVHEIAAEALDAAIANEKSRDAALSALVKKLSDMDASVWRMDARTFGEFIERCASVEALGAMAAKLQESYSVLKEKCRYGKEQEPIGTGFRFYRLMVRIADKKNALASQHDILLDEKPKPPKKGGVYQEIRRARNG
jgi:HEAT repeat protein